MALLSIDLTIPNLVFLLVLFFIGKKLFKLFQQWRMEKMLAKWANSPKDKVILHTMDRCKTMPSVSPYALKLETYLRMAKIPYELETMEPMGPKGKLPWITLNGVHVADSHLIIQFLNRKFSVDLNKNATPEQVAVARACRIVLEDHFLWGIVQHRWVENVSKLSQLFTIPPAFKLLMPLMANRIKKRMEQQGLGKHTRTEIYQMTEDDLRSVSRALGTKRFFGGEMTCEEDAGIFGGISQALWGMPGSSFERLVNGELNNLKEYCERMKQMYWPDWDSCIDKSSK